MAKEDTVQAEPKAEIAEADRTPNVGYGEANVSTGSSATLEPQLAAIKQGVFDNGNVPVPEGEAEDEAELQRRIDAAKAYEEVQNEIIRKREEAAEAAKKADPVELERRVLEQKRDAAKEYEEYSNTFVVAQNENRKDPVVTNYEVKEAFLSDREVPIEHRLEEGVEKVAADDALIATPSAAAVKAGQKRALEQADNEIELAKG